MRSWSLLAFLLAGCAIGGTGAGDGDVDTDTDTDTDADTDSDSGSEGDCERACDCNDCGGHGLCVSVAGEEACQCDENYRPAPGPTCIGASVDDPDGYCAKHPIRCLTLEYEGRVDECGSDECVVAWTETFDLPADMWLYRITTAGSVSTGCDCVEDVHVSWLVDGECLADGEGLVGEFVYTEAGLPETSVDVGRELVGGTHSLRAFRGSGCGRIEVESLRLLLSPMNP